MAFKRQRMGRRKVCYFTKNKITYIDYKDVDLSKPETLRGRVGTIACYQSITKENDDNSFIVMVSGYKDAWCQETLLDIKDN